MSERIRIIHKEDLPDGAEVEYRADILDDEYGGSVNTRLVSDTFFDWRYSKIDERNPFENPVQKSSFTCNLIFYSDAEKAILDDIIDSDEGRFTIKFYVDGTHKWSGFILTDLIEYPERGYPFTAKITAKDLSRAETADYDFETSNDMDRLSEIIADCLKNTGLTLPLRAFTNLSHADLSGTDNFLHALYHNKKALRDQDESISCYEALEKICRAYNLIIRQSGGRWIIEQLPAIADGGYNQYDFDSDGLNPSFTTPSRTDNVDRVDSYVLSRSENIIIGSLKEITSQYSHRTLINNLSPVDDITHTSSTDRTQITNDVEQDGTNRFTFSVDATLEYTNTGNAATNGNCFIEIIGKTPAGQVDLYYDQANNVFSPSAKDTEIAVTLDTVGTLTGSLDVSIEDSSIDSGIVGIWVQFKWGEAFDNGGSDAGITITSIEYSNISGYTYPVDTKDWTASLRYSYTRTGEYSLSEDIPATYLGDGPTGGHNFGSIGRPGTGTTRGDQVEPGNFRLKGLSENVLLQEIIMRERMNMRRNALRSLRVDLWMNYTPENLIGYDSETWFFMGGRFRAKSARWSANIMKLAYDDTTGGDVFSTIVESGGAPSGATGSGTSSSGISLSDADSRYVNIDGDTMTGDLDMDGNDLSGVENFTGGAIGSDLQAWSNDLDIYAANPLTAGELGELQNINSVTISNTQWGYLGDLDQSLATDQSVAFAGITNTGVLNQSNSSAIQDAGNNAIEFDGSGNITFPGNVTIDGTTVHTNVDNLEVDDPLIKLADGNATDSLDIGFIGQRSSDNIGLVWDESMDQFAAILTTDDATTAGNVTLTDYADFHAGAILADDSLTASNLTSGRVLIAGASGLITDNSGLTFDGSRLDVPAIGLDSSGNTYVLFKENGTTQASIEYNIANNWTSWINQVSGEGLRLPDTGGFDFIGGRVRLKNGGLELDTSGNTFILFKESGSTKTSLDYDITNNWTSWVNSTSGDELRLLDSGGAVSTGLLTAQGGIDAYGNVEIVGGTRYLGINSTTSARTPIWVESSSDLVGDGLISLASATNSNDRVGLGITYNGDNDLQLHVGRRYSIHSNMQKDITLDSDGKTYLSELLTAQGGIDLEDRTQADNFSAGSTGWQISYGGDWEGNDGYYRGDLQVDGGLFASEFVVEQTRVMTDFRMSVGGGRVESVSGSAGSETVTLSDDFGNANPFTDGDIVLIQQRTGANSGTILKKIYRRVASINSLDVTFSTTGITWTAGTANDDTGSIAAGDDISIVGHVSNANRDHFIHYDIAGVAVPAIRFFDGVDDVDPAVADEIMRVGGLDPGGTNEFSSDLSGDIGVAGKIGSNLAFAVTDSEGLIGGGYFDHEDMWGGNASKGSATTVIGLSSPKIALGASADSLGVSSTSDTGVYFDGSANARVGTTDGSGDMTAGYKFDGTDFFLEAVGTSISDTGFSFAGGVLSGDGSSLSINTGGGFQSADLYLDSGDGDFSIADKFYYDKSETELGLTGTLLMGTGSDITNDLSNPDYSLTEDGYSMSFATVGTVPSLTSPTGINWGGSSIGYQMIAYEFNNTPGGTDDYNTFYIERMSDNVKFIENVLGSIDGRTGVNETRLNGDVRITGVDGSLPDDDYDYLGDVTTLATLVLPYRFGGTPLTAIFTIDDSTISAQVDPSSFDTGFGEPDGTTGTDGKITIFIGGATGDEVWIENRSGGTLTYKYMIIGE